MSLWLKKHQPIQLYQGSELPYIILDDGIHLCFDNCYNTSPDKSEHNIQFNVESSKLKRINTFFYKLHPFPAIIPFKDVYQLDDAVIEGKIIRHTQASSGEPKSIAIVKSKYIRKSDVSELYDRLEGFDQRFIIVGNNIDAQVRLFEDSSHIIHHTEWPRTIVSIADTLCDLKDRKYCWSQRVQELNVDCYGINVDELSNIHESFTMIGIPDVSINWVD